MQDLYNFTYRLSSSDFRLFMNIGCINPLPSVVFGALMAPLLTHVVMLALYAVVKVSYRSPTDLLLAFPNPDGCADGHCCCVYPCRRIECLGFLQICLHEGRKCFAGQHRFVF